MSVTGNFVNSARSAILIGLMGNALAIAASCTILYAPPGSAIRPMHLPPLLLMIAAATVLPGMYYGFLAIGMRQRLLGTIGVLCSALPLVTGLVSFRLLVDFFGYTLKP